MYRKPHVICVAALVCQSGPALAIREPGSACGMPKAPDPGLAAVTLHRLSCSHSGSRQENWLDDQPNEPSVACAICRGEPDAAGTALLTARSAARFLAACRCAMASRVWVRRSWNAWCARAALPCWFWGSATGRAS
jgi:hypothetical protein